MRQVRSVLLLSVVLLVSLGSGRGMAIAQDMELTSHPIVGSWVLDVDSEDGADGNVLSVFTSDGAYLELEDDGAVSIGAWEATGDTTAIMTSRSVSPEGTVIVRASADVAEDGDSFTGEYTLEFIDPSGASSGEYGPGVVEGTRAEVEEPGEPAGSLADLFASFEPGTPEATPEG